MQCSHHQHTHLSHICCSARSLSAHHRTSFYRCTIHCNTQCPFINGSRCAALPSPNRHTWCTWHEAYLQQRATWLEWLWRMAPNQSMDHMCGSPQLFLLFARMLRALAWRHTMTYSHWPLGRDRVGSMHFLGLPVCGSCPFMFVSVFVMSLLHAAMSCLLF